MSLAEQSQQWFPTNVQVTVLQARGLGIKGKHGTNDAYAIMQVSKEKFSTSVAEKSVAPMWNEEATFDLPPFQQGNNADRCTLRVHVMHRALVGADKLLGQAVVNLLELSSVKSRNKTEWFKLLDKAGKPDKDRGEVLLDVQFTRNNLTASMFDLAGAGGKPPRSRLAKLKDRVRGQKTDGHADHASAAVATVTQVLTDSEGEDGDGVEEVEEEVEGKDGTKKKKKKTTKLKIKSLFSSKSNLQRNLSQSMSVLPPLPEKNAALSGSRSSGLNVDPSEAGKKFRFGLHKRSGSSDSRGLSLLLSPAAPGEPSSVCVNGSHVYRKEPPHPTSRLGPDRRLTCMTGEEEDEEVEEEEEDDGSRIREDEEVLRTEMERRREERRLLQERQREEQEEERARQREEERKREEEDQAEERRRTQEEKVRVEEERKQREEEERKRREEVVRIEDERKQERKRMQEEEMRRRAEEEEKRIKLEEQERIRAEEERQRTEEVERVKMEEEQAEDERRREKLEEDRRKRREEEERLKMERRREEEERVRMKGRRREEEEERLKMEEEEERKKIQEEEEERVRMEKRRREEEERMEEEEKRIKLEEQERIKAEEVERVRMKERKREEEERVRMEERVREEQGAERLSAETQTGTNKGGGVMAGKDGLGGEVATPTGRPVFPPLGQFDDDASSTNPFDQPPSPPPGSPPGSPHGPHPSPPPGPPGRTARVSAVKPRYHTALPPLANQDGLVVATGCIAKDPGSGQREKRPAPQPPGGARAARGLKKHEEEEEDQEEDQRLVQMIAPLRSPGDQRSAPCRNPGDVQPGTAARHGKAPAPPAPGSRSSRVGPSAASLPGATRKGGDAPNGQTASATGLPAAAHGYNPYEDDDDEREMEVAGQEVCRNDPSPPPATLSSLGVCALVAHAPKDDDDDDDDGVVLRRRPWKASRAPMPPAKNAVAAITTVQESHDTTDVWPSETLRAAGGGGEDLQTSVPGSVVKHGGSLPSESRPVAAQRSGEERGGKWDQSASNSRSRHHAVKPLEQPSATPGADDDDDRSTVFLSGAQEKIMVKDVALKGPYSQLSQAELISMVLKQQSQLSEREKKVVELEKYIDDLLVRVMEEKPTILMSLKAHK